MSSVNITVAIEGAPVYGMGAYEPTCTPLATPLLVMSLTHNAVNYLLWVFNTLPLSSLGL